MSEIYGNNIQMTEHVLDALWQRNQITTNNIANVDTPGFKSKYLTFEEELATRIKDADTGRHARRKISGAINTTFPLVHETTGESSRLDGNSVNMDEEQVSLLKTSLEYQYMTTAISSDLRRLNAAAKSF